VRSTALAIGLAAVLGVAGGVVTAFALPQHVEDPLHLGAALVNQPCRPGQSVVILASGAPSSLLSSAVETNDGARYLQPARSCDTTWRLHLPGETSQRPRFVDRGERLTVGGDCAQVLPQHHVRRVQVRDEAVELERPGLVVHLGQRRQDDGGGQKRPRVERAAGLLEEDRLVDERQPAAAAILGHGDPEPAQLAQLGEGSVRIGLEERARLAPQFVLFLRERELH